MFSLPLLAGQIERPDTLHKASVLCRAPVSSHQVCMCSFPQKHLSSWIRFTFLSHVPEEEILLAKSGVKWPKWMKLTGFQNQSQCQQGHKGIHHTLKVQWSIVVKNVLYNSKYLAIVFTFSKISGNNQTFVSDIAFGLYSILQWSETQSTEAKNGV